MDFTTNLHGKKIFSKVDLLKGYHQIPVAEGDIGKTAVITPFGLFIFPRCPFGLKNAGQDFQRMMDAILGDLPFCYVYLDDILVFSNSPEEHMKHLRQIFDLLAENGLVVNRAKCVLGVKELDFLGFHVNQDGILPLPDKVDAIRATKPPTSIKELQRFLGMVGYYRRSIKSAAHHLDHLYEALVGNPKKLDWTQDRETSFQATKEALAKAAMLHHPRPDASLALTTDASKIAMGGVLEQRGPKGWEPLAFFSARLRGKQREWPPFDRELLAAFRSIRHFRHLLEGRNFTLYTDHQSLIPALSCQISRNIRPTSATCAEKRTSSPTLYRAQTGKQKRSISLSLPLIALKGVTSTASAQPYLLSLKRPTQTQFAPSTNLLRQKKWKN